MKKTTILITAIITALLLASCAQQTDRTGYVTFGYAAGRDVFATIGYPDVNSLTWDITATKLSKGSKTGEGVLSDALLTDEFGPFSTGRWEFTLVGKDTGTAVYEGVTTAYIAEGANTVVVTVDPIGETGTLVFSGCNFPPDNGNGAEYSGAQILIDGERVFGISRNHCQQNANGMWVMADQTTALTAGLHDIEVMFVGNEPMTAESFKVRIVGGLTTTVTFGIFEESPVFDIVVDEQEALEDE